MNHEKLYADIASRFEPCGEPLAVPLPANYPLNLLWLNKPLDDADLHPCNPQ